MMARPGHSPIMLGSGGSGLIRTVLGSKEDLVGASVFNFNGFDIGEADSGRFLVAALTARKSSIGGAVTSVTIGGLAATDLATAVLSDSGRTIIASLHGVTVPTGTTADVVLTLANNFNHGACTLYKLMGLNSTTPDDTDTDTSPTSRTVTMNVTPLAGGLALAAAAFDGSTSTDAAWTELTEDYDEELENLSRHTMASKQAPLPNSALTITCTRDDFNALECAGAAIAMR